MGCILSLDNRYLIFFKTNCIPFYEYKMYTVTLLYICLVYLTPNIHTL